MNNINCKFLFWLKLYRCHFIFGTANPNTSTKCWNNLNQAFVFSEIEINNHMRFRITASFLSILDNSSMTPQCLQGDTEYAWEAMIG